MFGYAVARDTSIDSLAARSSLQAVTLVLASFSWTVDTALPSTGHQTFLCGVSRRQ